MQFSSCKLFSGKEVLVLFHCLPIYTYFFFYSLLKLKQLDEKLLQSFFHGKLLLTISISFFFHSSVGKESSFAQSPVLSSRATYSGTVRKERLKQAKQDSVSFSYLFKDSKLLTRYDFHYFTFWNCKKKVKLLHLSFPVEQLLTLLLLY